MAFSLQVKIYKKTKTKQALYSHFSSFIISLKHKGVFATGEEDVNILPLICISGIICMRLATILKQLMLLT